MKRVKNVGLWPTVVLAGVIAVVLGSIVVAGSENDQGGKSWPFEVKTGPTTNSPSAWSRLEAIHNLAIDHLPTASAADKPHIIKVLKRSFKCAAYDGEAMGAPQAHSAPHTVAAQNIEEAWAALHIQSDPPVPPEWAVCADKLEHGHDE